MATSTFNISKQYMADSLAGSANPGDSHIPIGKWAAGTGLNWVGRALLYAPISFSGMAGINEARLYLYQHTAAGYHAKGTGTVSVDTRRKTADWSETSGGTSSSVDENWTGNGETYVNNNYYDDGDPQGSVNNGNGDGTLMYIDVTDIVTAWYNGSNNYGLMLYAISSVEAGACEFYSRHESGKVPYIWIDYSTNTAPNAPVNLSPSSSAQVHTGTSITYSVTHSDADFGDVASSAEFALINDNGTTILDEWTVTGINLKTFTHTRSLPAGYAATSYYKWKVRTRDAAGVWGPYSSHQRFRSNTAPNTPTGLAEDSDSLTPNFSGGFSDSDSGDTMTAVQIQVYRSSDGATMWSSADLAASGSSWNKSYAGSALSIGGIYTWRARVKDSFGAYSSWSASRAFTVTAPTGPTLSPRSIAYGVAYGGKQATTTPTMTITYTSNFINHEVKVFSNASGSALVQNIPATTNYASTGSKTQVLATLTNGTQYWWQARVLLTDGITWTAWSTLGGTNFDGSPTLATFYINALPTAPTNLQIMDNPGTTPVTRPSDGVFIATSLVPVFLAKYNDPDLLTYNDVPGNRDIEVVNDTTGAAVMTLTNIATVFTDPVVYRLGTTAGASTTLAALAVTGATNIKVTSVTGISVGERLIIGAHNSPNQEVVLVSAVGTAGSGGTGITFTTTPLKYDHANAEAVVEITAVLALDTMYKVRTRFKDNTGNYGAWSSYVRFKITTPSTLGSVTPSGTVTSPSFTVAWNHTGSAGKAQGKYRVFIKRTSDSEIVYDSGYITSSTESHVVPGGYLRNSTAYTVSVEAVDTDNI
jgi:hypothetical protein